MTISLVCAAVVSGLATVVDRVVESTMDGVVVSAMDDDEDDVAVVVKISEIPMAVMMVSNVPATKTILVKLASHKNPVPLIHVKTAPNAWKTMFFLGIRASAILGFQVITASI